jgi:DNA-binding SARP family transcriptional activator
MRFRVLGPLEVRSGDDWASISAGKWRSLLACLLLQPGRIVPTETLIDELWGDAPPPTANNLVSIYVHRLRRAIGDAEGRVLVHRKPGYQLKLHDDDTDRQQFERLTADGRDALADGDTETAVALLSLAESLWHGRFLADVSPSVLISTEAERLTELRLAAAELRIGAQLASGRPAQVVPELRTLVTEHPFREGLWLLLMRALDAAGRHAEALGVYGQAREVISSELGVDPGAELQTLYADLLAVDAASSSAPPAPASPASLGPAHGQRESHAPASNASGWSVAGSDVRGSNARGPRRAQDGTPASAVPSAEDTDDQADGEPQGTIAIGSLASVHDESGERDAVAAVADRASAGQASSSVSGHGDHLLPDLAQLPADIGDFTGRAAQVGHLCDMLTRRDAASGPGVVRIAVVAGAAGLGKTTLAVHAAHQVRDLFPDGQLYVDLSSASAEPAAPSDVLVRLLRDLGVDGDKVPADSESRAALYRTRLTGRRVLILLDNAKDAAQVRPLLPGTASCAVLVTTRNRPTDLVSTRFVDLNVLSDLEALELFTRIVGDDRPVSEPDATAEVLLACAGLPLAIRICAARLAARRQWKVATLANRLRDEHRRLDELQTGDMEVRASFQVSYDSLRAGRHQVDPARVFRLLGLWQGRQIGLQAATALADDSEGDVAAALETLVDANLLESPAPDWYRFHDLLRVFATERAEAETTEGVRDEAVARLLRWYLGAAEAAADVISPRRYRVPHDETPKGSFEPPADVFGWYDDERGNLIAATRQAAAAGLHDIAWRLPVALFPLFNRRDNWTDCVSVHRTGLISARKVGNRRGEAWVLQNLGQALAKLRSTEALGHLEEAFTIRSETGDRDGEAQTAVSLAEAYYKLHGPAAALEHSLRCLEVLREVGNGFHLGIGLNNHSEFCLELGRLDEAAECLREALDIPPEISGYGYGHATLSLGRVLLESGRFDDAIASLREAHQLHLASGDLIGQANALKYLGTAQRQAGQGEAARESWTAALVIFENLKADAEVAEIHIALAALLARARQKFPETAVSGSTKRRDLASNIQGHPRTCLTFRQRPTGLSAA